MEKVIDSLFITLGLKSEEIGKGLQKAESVLQGGLKRIMTGFVAPLTSALALGKMFGDYTKMADDIGDFSDAIGLNIEEIQAWGEAAKRAGGTQEGLRNTLQTLSANLVHMQTTGGGRMKPFFDELGINAKKSSGEMKNAFEILSDISGKFEGMDKQKSLGLGQRLGLDRGTIMLLQNGREGLDELIKSQKELGVYSKRDAEIAGRYGDAMDDLVQSFRAASAVAMRVVVPAITKIAEIATEGTKWLRENEPFVLGFIGALVIALSARLIPTIMRLGAAIAANPMFWVWTKLAAVIAAVALAIDDLYAYINGGNSYLKDFWAIFGTGEEISAKLAGTWEFLKSVGSGLLNILKEYGPQIFGIVTAFLAVDGVISVIKKAKDAFLLMNSAIAANPIALVALSVATAAYLIINNWEELKTFFDGLWNWLVSVSDQAIEKLKQAWTNIKEWFSGIFTGIVDSFKEKWDGAISAFTSKFMAAINKIRNAWGSVKNFFGFGEEEIPHATPQYGNVDTLLNSPYRTQAQHNAGVSPLFFPSGEGSSNALAPSTIDNRTNIDQNTSVNIAKIDVVTQATDANGIASSMNSAVSKDINNRGIVQLGNVGVSK